jgi:hypothetical protein
MVVIVKRPLAELDLLGIWEFIAEDSPDRADEFLDRLEGTLLRQVFCLFLCFQQNHTFGGSQLLLKLIFVGIVNNNTSSLLQAYITN